MDLHIYPSQKPSEAWKLNKSINTLFPFVVLFGVCFFFSLIEKRVSWKNGKKMKSSNKTISADRKARLDKPSSELPLSQQGKGFCQPHTATISAPAAENFQCFLNKINCQGAPPAWDVLPAPRAFLCSGTGLCQLQVTLARPRDSKGLPQQHGQCQGLLRSSSHTGRDPGKQPLCLALAAGCVLVLWPLAKVLFKILPEQNVDMGDGRGEGEWHRRHQPLCPSTGASAGDTAHQATGTHHAGFGLFTKILPFKLLQLISCFRLGRIIILNKETAQQLEKEMPLTVPAVSRISSIHCWQSTSTCWGKRNKQLRLNCLQRDRQEESELNLYSCHNGLSAKQAPALPQVWAALLLED